MFTKQEQRFLLLLVISLFVGLGVKYVRAVRADKVDEKWQQERDKILAEFYEKSEKLNREELLAQDKEQHLGVLTKESLTEHININDASCEELQILPRIGPAIAQKIISYREEHGPFRSIDEIQNVKNIGPKTFEKIKDYITIE